MHIEGAQKVVFYVLIFASLGYMAWQVFDMARQWRKGKPISWKPNYFEGVWKFVLGQKKVQGSRKKSGAPMHMMIFYGFLALFVATTLLAISDYGFIVGIPHFHEGGYYLAYEMTFDIFGVVFMVGLAWAFLRRYAYFKKFGDVAPDPRRSEKEERSRNPLTQTAQDQWALVLLFCLGITGFSVEAARMANNPQSWDWSAPVGFALAKLMGDLPDIGYVGIWWVHSVLVAVFFAVLPKMRLRHIVMATMTAAGRPEQPMGELKPISMEEVEATGKIGVSEAPDYSRWHLMSLDACMSCGRCTEVCPAYNVGKVLNPKQVVADIHKALVMGDGVPARVSEEALWQCTTCNACVEACPVLIRHVDMIVDARRGLVAEGKLSGTGAVMLRQVGSTGHAWGAQSSNREDWMKGLDVPLARDGGDFEYLFWVGCAGATDPAAVKTTKAVAELLKKAGVSFACLGKEEACTGDPARRAGDEFLYQEKAAQNISIFEKYGVKKVVTACPHCFNTLLNEYGQFGPKMEVFHHTQLLQQLIAEERLKPAKVEQGEVTYHDPCYLARINNESDAPRAMVGEETHYNSDKAALVHALESPPDEGKVLAEPEHAARKTLCCGAGGARMWMEEEPNQRPGVRRANELLKTGAKTVAVSCPFCRIMLDASIKQATEEPINLVDMAELMQESNRA